MFRGAWRYNFGDIGGLRRPWINSNAIKYAAYDKPGTSQGFNLGNWSYFGINPNIAVYRYKSNGAEFASDEIFSTTCHETAHTTHWRAMNAGIIQFSQVTTSARESWATAVEWSIVQKEYRERGIANYAGPTYDIVVGFPIRYGRQEWFPGISNTDYSCVYIDLVDDFNQSTTVFPFTGRGIADNVRGYNLATIEATFLKNVYGYSSLSNALKNNKPAGVSNAQIDELISQF